jgi:hypothetical protein
VCDYNAAELHRVVRAPLLPGEVADSRDRDDIEHWVAVYEQLAGFLNEFNAAGEMQERYRRRLRFWRGRRAEVAQPASEYGHWSEAVE